jgi:beta-alanine--pyruvate transaminase
VTLHDASTIAAVIVEPIAGSTGVVLPPQGYLKRLREICDKYGILLIFDEVITGLRTHGVAFRAQEFGVTPTSSPARRDSRTAPCPWARCWCRRRSTTRSCRAAGRHRTVPRLHLLRASHRLRGGLATIGIYENEKLLTRAKQMAPLFEKAVHALRGLPHVIDIRNYGTGRGYRARPDRRATGARAFGIYLKCFERGLLLRTTGDVIALSPALIIEPTHIEELFGILSQAIKDSA